MNVFNCILKNKATIIIPCFADDCNIGKILDKLSEQGYSEIVTIGTSDALKLKKSYI